MLKSAPLQNGYFDLRMKQIHRPTKLKTPKPDEAHNAKFYSERENKHRLETIPKRTNE